MDEQQDQPQSQPAASAPLEGMQVPSGAVNQVEKARDVRGTLMPRYEAKKLITKILSQKGKISLSKKHCRDRMEERGITSRDIDNVLRNCRINDEPEPVGSAYRYRAETDKFYVIVEFRSEDELCVVTAFRNNRRNTRW